jgi:CHAP domain-containing protein/putative peptidoglycan binding protein
MDYPNRIIKSGETDTDIVTAIQNQLNATNCGPLTVDGIFGDSTVSAVKLFQTRHTDSSGTPLKADGQVGPITWSILFGSDSVQSNNSPASPLLAKVLEVAASQIGVIEDPPNSNRGPQVDEYLRTVGLDPEGQHYSWCAAFVYWCFQQAADQLGVNNPLIKTAGCLDHWNRATCPEITKQAALKDPSLIKPGFIFIIDHGDGSGHTGLVESSGGGLLTTIEGNTNIQLSSNGYGVFRLDRRKIVDITKGFLDYSGA